MCAALPAGSAGDQSNASVQSTHSGRSYPGWLICSDIGAVRFASMYRRHMAEGRLADPDCSLGTDPRSDPRMVEALAQFGLDANMPVVPLTIDAPLEERLAYAEMSEAGMGAVLDAFASGVPDADGVTTTTTTITGEDGNDVTLYISRPDVDGPLPAVVHLHGGGMAIASAADAMYSRIREYLAGTGLVVVGVEFRNSG